MKKLLLTIFLALFASCSDSGSNQDSAISAEGANVSSPMLEEILDSQTDAMKNRYEFRRPQETLEFFGIRPGMTVVEALPGGGWYTKLLRPFLGSGGTIVGANYPMGVWSLFGYKGERLDNMASWPTSWPAENNEKSGLAGGAEVKAFLFGDLPDSMHGTADVVLMIRAMHWLALYESQGGHLTSALKNTYDILKAGGIVGIVQHQAREEMPDEWADGSRGYLKKAFVIELMTQAGFELLADSDLNQNEKDQPTIDDVVWRLPPTLRGSKDSEELKRSMISIGESNRMTLKFKKPA